MPTHAEFVQGLRELADFYSAHPEVKLPLSCSYYICDATKEETLAAARAFGDARKTYTNVHFILRKTFPSGVEIWLMTDRKTVCTAKEIGEKFVPAYTIPAQHFPASTVPVLEWECLPLLAPDPEPGEPEF
jgi:hypothetical protein